MTYEKFILVTLRSMHNVGNYLELYKMGVYTNLL